MHPPINPPVPRYLLPAKSSVEIAKADDDNHSWIPHTTIRDICCQTLFAEGILKHNDWLYRFAPAQLVDRNHPIIHSLWFDFESKQGTGGFAVPVDEYGENDGIRPVESRWTLLDVVAGDLLFNGSVLRVTRVAIFQATPAPEVTADKPVLDVLFGKAWLAEMRLKMQERAG